MRIFHSEREKHRYYNSLSEAQKYDAFSEILFESESVVFLGGAGVSTESGIPDFRSKNGLYKKKDRETWLAIRSLLKEHGFVVYLKVTAAEAASRISDVSTRPLFGDIDQAERVIQGRLPLYEEVADICIDTNGRGTGSIAREVFKQLKDEGILWQPKL